MRSQCEKFVLVNGEK